MIVIPTTAAEHIASELHGKKFKMAKLKDNKSGKKVFPDNELYVAISDINKVKKDDSIAVIHSRSIGKDPNADYAELLLLLRCLKENGCPAKYVFFLNFPYQRQDNIFEEGEFNTAKSVIDDLLGNYGIKAIFAIDPHFSNKSWLKEYSENNMFVSLTVKNLLLKKAAEEFKTNDFAIIGPDLGAMQRYDVASFSKTRVDSETVEMDIESIHQDMRGKNVLIMDDIISTGGTMIKAIELCKKKGAKKVFVAAVHGTILEGIKKIKMKSERLFLANTIDTTFSNVDVSGLVAEVLEKLK